MISVKDKWLEKLLQDDIIECFDTTFGEHYRLRPCVFDISANIIQVLKREYHPGLEKGGYLLATPEKRANSNLFVVKEVRFIRNTSLTPWEQYRKEISESEAAISYALNNDLVPFFFHSHPTKSANIIGEAFMYNRQMDTSSADKFASLFSGISFGKLQLRLPDVLVVVNGRLKGDTFIGFYGGLVTPLDFTERKQVLNDTFSDKVSDSFESLLKTPEKRLLGTLLGCLFLFFLIKFPKSTFTVILTGAAIVPSIAYSSLPENEFFGISHGSSLQVSLIKISDESIISDEKFLKDLLADWKKKLFNKAA